MKADLRTRRRKTGDLGEDLACQFLVKRGYQILERNYLRKWGEIDIVAKKGEVIHFVEVKSVSRVTLSKNVSDETPYRPEENMHPGKIRKLMRTIETYMLHRKLDCQFQLDLVTVRMDMHTRKARVELLERVY